MSPSYNIKIFSYIIQAVNMSIFKNKIIQKSKRANVFIYPSHKPVSLWEGYMIEFESFVSTFVSRLLCTPVCYAWYDFEKCYHTLHVILKFILLFFPLRMYPGPLFRVRIYRFTQFLLAAPYSIV